MLARLTIRIALLALVLSAFVAATDNVRAQGGTEVDLDTYRLVNSSPILATGPVLASGRHYTITIVGTFSYWFASDWQNQGVCAGATPEDAPVFPSPNTTNGKVGDDAAWHFAGPNTFSDCSGPFPQAGPSLGISLDGGNAYHSLVVDDPGTAPNPSHTYHLSVVGEGDAVVLSFEDQKLVDNYGILEFTVEEPLTWGDNDCSGSIEALDTLPTLVHGFGTAGPAQAHCMQVGQFLETQSFGAVVWGDIDCSGQFDAPDILLILRQAADLPPASLQDCPALGTTLVIAPD